MDAGFVLLMPLSRRIRSSTLASSCRLSARNSASKSHRPLVSAGWPRRAPPTVRQSRHGLRVADRDAHPGGDLVVLHIRTQAHGVANNHTVVFCLRMATHGAA